MLDTESFPAPEQGPKLAPTKEQVSTLRLQTFIGEVGFAQRKEERIYTLQDSEAPYEWVFVIKNMDDTSGEYTYALEGDFTRLPGASNHARAEKTAIYVAYLDTAGVLDGGKQLAGMSGGPDSALRILED